MRFWKIWDKAGIYIIAIMTIIVFAILSPLLLTPVNIINVLVQTSITAIAAAGMTFAITGGGFDLSVGSTLALTTCIIGLTVPQYGILIGVMIALCVGVIIGLFNGIVISKLKIQTFVATLATMIIIRGVAFLVTDGKDILFTQYAPMKMFSSGIILGIPVPILITAIVYILAYTIYKYTSFGVYVRSIGSNESTARISGINVDKALILIFVMTASTAVISGIIQSSQTLVGNGRYGMSFPLDVITATILGGTSLSGGKGNIWGSLVAATMLATIKNGLNLLNVSVYYQGLTTGLVLIFALLMTGIKEMLEEKAA